MKSQNAARPAMDGTSLITPQLIGAERGRDGTPEQTREIRDVGEATGRLSLTLRLAQDRFAKDRPAAEIVAALATDLHVLRRSCIPEVWQAIIPFAQAHPLAAILREDPFTDWSCRKPRGYSGDAGLLDFIYGHESIGPALEATTERGRAIYDYTKDASSSVAVRERRDILARLVDEAAERTQGSAEVLAIAAGHLREAGRSRALAESRLARWVALDQDPMSVGTIARDHRGTAIEAVDGSVRSVLRRSSDLGTFDLAYAAGLYDYLPHGFAVRLTQRCVEMLKPGGTFLFANFADELGVDGYMETFMDWALLLRSEGDMWDIVNAAVDRNAVEANVWKGENGNVVYATLRKLA